MLLLALVLLPGRLAAQRYELVWSDEFDTLDRATWQHWIGTAYNNELQYYTARDTNSYARDGMLYLWAQNENFGGRQYTSARIESKAQGGHKYGRFEARAKLPTGAGIWPAIWMMPTKSVYGGWPRSGEIDIMEWRGDLPARTYGTLHYQFNGGHRYTGTTWDLPQGTFSDTFHVFAIEWDETRIRWFVDDYMFNEITLASLGATPMPFDQEFFWILNVAVGGDFLPNPPAGSKFRQAMVVDYVRVYQDVNQKPTLGLGALPDTVRAGELLDLSIRAADADGQVDSVAVYLDGVRVASGAGAVLDWQRRLADGCYDVEARAYDNDGGEGTAAARVVVGRGCTQRSFGAVPFRLPGTVPFAHYDYGGPNVGYFDLTPDVNTGGAATFRPTEGVDVRPHATEADAYVVTDVEAGEWLAYSIEVPEGGLYDITVRALTPGVYGRVRLQLGSTTLVRSLLIEPGTPEQPAMAATAAGVMMPAGLHVLRVTALFDGFELDRITFARTGATAAEGDAPVAAAMLFPAQPNPVREEARARFALGAPTTVSLHVVDVLGRVVARLADETFPAGTHTVPFSRAGLASGLYLLRLVTPGAQQTRPLVLVD